MNIVYKENLKCLGLEIRNIISKIESDRHLKILKSRTGNFTLEAETIFNNKILLHSKYNPIKEAERFVKTNSLKGFKEIILVGFGFGYHVEKILSRLNNNQHLNIIIPNLDVFKLALEKRNLVNVLGNKQVNIILEKEKKLLLRKIQSLLEKFSSEDSKVISHQQSIKIIPKSFLFLKDIMEEIKINQKSQKRFSEVISNNIINNIEELNRSIGVKEFKSTFEEVPIFIVSAGPSLNNNIKDLKLVKDKGIIISVDTSVPLLLDNHIYPDFIVTIDPVQTSYSRFYKEIKGIGIPLVYSMGANHELVKGYSGPKIVGLSKQDISMNKINSEVDKGRIETNNTVAITALDFARILGGNPIIFVGQDFAFSQEGVTHASSVFSEERKVDTSLLREVEGINGEKVYTSLTYYLPLKRFERYIEKYSTINYIDATEGGAKIKGTEIMKLKDVINKYCDIGINKSEIIAKVINSFKTNKSKLSTDRIKRLLEEGL
ncbi:motility associated factor glycosyltransferase family protein [Orenia marismortui]|uniref:motility associated factor glycosyltransferase family protein n=1 Tax=Orenia marismortui TaxID=46469 RepID=UPI000360E959|nr:6-hydroxymethylpterin diphosphokinase MptE-like protein [Orenia marismortui]